MLDWVEFAKRYGLGALAVLLLLIHALVDIQEDSSDDKALALLERRVLATEAALARLPKPQNTRFGQDIDRRVDLLERQVFYRYPHQPLSPTPQE